MRKTKTSQEFKLSSPSNSWMQIRELSQRKAAVINNLFRHMSTENLRQAYHAIDGSKAVGIDKVTKDQYGVNLEDNLRNLVNNLHKGVYRPQIKRGVEIPKANGKTRLIAIGNFEDKLVEWVLANILTELYEPLFIENSYGFRPKRSTHQAIKTIYDSLFKKKQNYIVDIDIKSFFDTVSHRKLIKMLEKRISDNKLLSLVSRLLEVGVLTNGITTERKSGTPQGGIVSPVLSNIYLHHVLDIWFIENYAKTGGVISRYADDVVFTFSTEEESKRFETEVRKRFADFNLEVNEDKSRQIDFKPKSGNIFNFTGFTFYWGNERGRKIKTLKIKTQKDRITKTTNELNLWLKENRNKYNLEKIWQIISSKLRGHYNYFGFAMNRPKLIQFYHHVTKLLFKWLNRRSQKKSFSSERFKLRLMQYPLPFPPNVSKLKQLRNRGWAYGY